MIDALLGIPADVGSPQKPEGQPLSSGSPSDAATFLALLTGEVGEGEFLAGTATTPLTQTVLSGSEGLVEGADSPEGQEAETAPTPTFGKLGETSSNVAQQFVSAVHSQLEGKSAEAVPGSGQSVEMATELSEPGVSLRSHAAPTRQPAAPNGAIVSSPESGETVAPPAANVAAVRGSPAAPESLNGNAKAPVITLPEAQARGQPSAVEVEVVAEFIPVARVAARSVQSVQVTPQPEVRLFTGGQPSQGTVSIEGGFVAPQSQANASLAAMVETAEGAPATAAVKQETASAMVAETQTQKPSPEPLAIAKAKLASMKATHPVTNPGDEVLASFTGGKPAQPVVVPAAAPGSQSGQLTGGQGQNPNPPETGRSPGPVAAPVVAEEPETAAITRAETGRPVLNRAPIDRMVEAQIVRGARLMVKGGQTEMTLRLHPPHLGLVKLNLVFSDSQIGITVHAESEAVRQMIQFRTAELHQSLQDRGVDVSYINVAADLNSGLQERHWQPIHAGPSQPFRLEDGELTADGTDTTNAEVPLRVNQASVGLDIMV